MSKPPQQVPAPPGSTAGNSYTRFIPKEELGSFAAWHPDALQADAPAEAATASGVQKQSFAERVGAPVHSAQAKTAAPTSPSKPTKEAAPVSKPSAEQQAKDARQAGYQDGYRDGLAAMESFKQTQSAQMAAFMSEQVGSVVAALHGRLDAVEQQLSGRIAGVALELARQVVRSEVVLRPELVVQVAEEALQTLLDSARHVTVHLNPQDMRFTTELLQERLEHRGARLVADKAISPGGCLVESDIALVDATLEARWEHAATALGMTLGWDEPGHAKPMVVEDDDGDEVDEEIDMLDPKAKP